ncbi:hypothetical protein SCG7109_AB_00510 [Chlamydiales bacterium SCGC AG-110-M15]|nr:hypothetical protein SCG7109_AB_00510 [Chlamydiales bacterium SCGC AG-110-M15]
MVMQDVLKQTFLTTYSEKHIVDADPEHVLNELTL